MAELIKPHGGVLKNLYLSREKADQEKRKAMDYPSWDLTPRQSCDIELLLNGAFSPLEGFMGRADYDRVVEEMRLANGTMWPMPITLDVSKAFSEKIERGSRIASARRARYSARSTARIPASLSSPSARIRSTSAAACTAARRPRTTTSSTCAIHRRSFAGASASKAGAR